jgi:hypothetical protein
VKGWFNETLPVFLEQQGDLPVAFLHVDCDLYSSTKTIFNELSDRIISGTVIVFDEYINYSSWRRDEWLAFTEFCTARKLNYQYIGLVPQSHQAAVLV